MKAKLIKVGDHYDLYYRDEVEDLIIGFASTDSTFERKLSVKNCQEIERGYDSDELADENVSDIHEANTDFMFKDIYREYFKEGFQKALDIHYNDMNILPRKTKWEVIVEMEDIQEIHVDGVLTLQPKLDADGCLILKRIP